ncbi:MAG TPA: hypothetical protein VMF66_20150 [Candidatus Acidoferrum sp.]|nr:hypothetical protein [Candidatus Acidoferrum sp.]
MKKRVAMGLLIFAAVAAVGWQIASIELGNIEFHDDLRYIAAQTGMNIGLNTPKTDEQVREEVVRAAAEDGIHLQPDQVKLQRISVPYYVHFNLAVSYTRRLNLLVYSFNLRFNQTSAKK